EFDLSAGVMIGSSGLLLGYLTTHAHMNVWPAIVLVLLFGVAVGLVNGIAVVRTRLPSFIVTLATFFILQGVNAAGTLKVTGTAFGAAMLGMVQLGIIDAQWDSNWTYTFQGAILFIAVILNTVIRSRAQRVR